MPPEKIDYHIKNFKWFQIIGPGHYRPVKTITTFVPDGIPLTSRWKEINGETIVNIPV